MCPMPGDGLQSHVCGGVRAREGYIPRKRTVGAPITLVDLHSFCHRR